MIILIFNLNQLNHGARHFKTPIYSTRDIPEQFTHLRASERIAGDTDSNHFNASVVSTKSSNIFAFSASDDKSIKIQYNYVSGWRLHHKCPYCSYISVYKTCVLKHIKREYEREIKRYETQIANVNVHIINFDSRKKDCVIKKKYKCNLCPYSTNRTRDLNRHLNVHARRAKYQEMQSKESHTDKPSTDLQNWIASVIM